MRTKRIFSALLAGMICMGITACDTPTDTGKPSDETPHGTYENRMIVKTVGIDTSPMTDGETLFHRNTENALVKMTNENGIWKTEPVITEQMLHYTAMWNGDFLLYLTETGSEIPAWYVYDTETAACEPLAISLSDAAAEAMRDVSGICVIGDDLFIMHSYWQGISRIDLATGECVNFDSETWGNFTACSADEASFYINKPYGVEVFDLVTGEKSVYDWSESEYWLGSAELSSAFLTEDHRMYLHIAREDAMVPDEQKRAVLYADTTGDMSALVSVTALGSLPAYSVTCIYGEYYGTLVLTDGDILYAYDTQNDKIAELCALPKANLVCVGKYVMTQQLGEYHMLAEIPASVS